VHIEREEPAGLVRRFRRLAQHDDAALAGHRLVVAVAQRDTGEVEHRETAFAWR